ncbi:MAG: non-canonical purine NTP pyrophosphatase [Chitinophagaceae bacterium]
MAELLSGVQILSLDDIGFTSEIEEPYLTFHENAWQKANTVFQFCGLNVLADDSGICVPVLNNEPGVLSARYAGDHASDDANLRLLLKNMEGHTDRRAFYKAVLCLFWNGMPSYFEGTCHGTLLRQEQGSGGFGYDPIFVPDGYDASFGELDAAVKQQISHRANAMRQLIAFAQQ